MAYGTVEEVFQYEGEGLALSVTEFRLNDVYQPQNFTSNGKVKLSLSDGTILTERILPIITGVTFSSDADGSGVCAGYAYATGDVVSFNDGGLGSGARALVSSVDSDGAIISVEMSDYGSNYTSTPTTIVTRRGITGGMAAGLTAIVGPYVETDGKFLDESGWLSSTKKLQDSYYYQNYSYVVKSDMILDTFKELVKKTIHPTGMNLFAQVQINRELESDLPFSARMSGRTKPIIGHYTPYTFTTSSICALV